MPRSATADPRARPRQDAARRWPLRPRPIAGPARPESSGMATIGSAPHCSSIPSHRTTWSMGQRASRHCLTRPAHQEESRAAPLSGLGMSRATHAPLRPWEAVGYPWAPPQVPPSRPSTGAASPPSDTAVRHAPPPMSPVPLRPTGPPELDDAARSPHAIAAPWPTSPSHPLAVEVPSRAPRPRMVVLSAATPAPRRAPSRPTRRSAACPPTRPKPPLAHRMCAASLPAQLPRPLPSKAAKIEALVEPHVSLPRRRSGPPAPRPRRSGPRSSRPPTPAPRDASPYTGPRSGCRHRC